MILRLISDLVFKVKEINKSYRLFATKFKEECL